ncbi:MAG: tRNA (adenosine(37)-N6)-threonylcarbamoyltransferase complex transferase subunit TsaD [Myxococcota bacterium]|nr:tRNA (adenosine(37)-N6)-threonylcarbamoyltransferase complex transferase subunit TsaD [Myxococcota bacterium]
MRILGIESSCDETAAAVIETGYTVVSNVVHSQVARHQPFGGVVPEIASREHLTKIGVVVEKALEESGGVDTIDAIAVTTGPGLVGSLLVGVQFAKGFALATGKPWIGINHLEGHLAAAYLGDVPVGEPHLAMVVSGGHTQFYAVTGFGQYELIGGTRDDAAGECFDKVAKVMGLPYPGGLHIDRRAAQGDGNAHRFPRAMNTLKHFDLSFSGLKTSAIQYWREHQPSTEEEVAHFCASFQEAIADILTKKAVAAAKSRGLKGIVLAGGVAANSRLRGLLEERAKKAKLWSFLPPVWLCTDNGAMIAAAGLARQEAGLINDAHRQVRSRWPLSAMS